MKAKVEDTRLPSISEMKNPAPQEVQAKQSEALRSAGDSTKQKIPEAEASGNLLEVTTRFELVDEGFADPCLTTWPRHHIRSNCCCSIWSGRRGSNSLPPPWQGGALPDELRPHIRCIYPCTLPFFNGAPAKICEANVCVEEEKVWRSSQQSCLQDCTMNSRTFDEATRIGLEPTTPSVTGWCSNQLSYRAMIAQVHRFWRLTAGTCVIIPEKRAVVKHEF